MPNASKMGTVTLPPGIHTTSDLSIGAEEYLEPVIEPPIHSDTVSVSCLREERDWNRQLIKKGRPMTFALICTHLDDNRTMIQ